MMLPSAAPERTAPSAATATKASGWRWCARHALATKASSGAGAPARGAAPPPAPA